MFLDRGHAHDRAIEAGCPEPDEELEQHRGEDFLPNELQVLLLAILVLVTVHLSPLVSNLSPVAPAGCSCAGSEFEAHEQVLWGGR